MVIYVELVLIITIPLVLLLVYVVVFKVPTFNSSIPEKEIIDEAEILIIDGKHNPAIILLEDYLKKYPNHPKANDLLKNAKNLRT